MRKNGWWMNGPPGVVGEETEEIRRGALQLNFQRVGIRCLGADLREVFEFTFVKGCGAFDRVQHVRIGSAQSRAEDAFNGEQEVFGGDRGAIGPVGGRIEVEAVAQAVIGDGPELGDAWLDCHCLGVQRGQAFVEREHDGVLGETGGNVRVKCGGFCADADVELLFRVAFFDVSGLPGAPAQYDKEGAEDEV